MAGPDEASLRLLFQEIKDVLAGQRAAGERIDDKAASLATFNAVVLGLVTTGLTSRLADAPPSPAWLTLATAIGLALLLASLLAAIVVYRPIDYAMGLDATSVQASLGYDITAPVLLREAIQAYHDGVQRNARAVAAKATWLRRSLWLLFFPGMLLAVAGASGFILEGLQ